MSTSLSPVSSPTSPMAHKGDDAADHSPAKTVSQSQTTSQSPLRTSSNSSPTAPTCDLVTEEHPPASDPDDANVDNADPPSPRRVVSDRSEPDSNRKDNGGRSPSPTLHEIDQLAQAIPLPPSREPSLSPPASFWSSGSKYSDSPTPSPRNASHSHSRSRSHSLARSLSDSRSASLPQSQLRLASETEQDSASTTDSLVDPPATALQCESLESSANSVSAIPRSQSLGFNLRSKHTSTAFSARRSPLSISPAASPSRLADRVHHRRSLGSGSRSPRTSPRKELLAGLRDLHIDVDRIRKRSCDHLDDGQVALPATAVALPLASERSSPVIAPVRFPALASPPLSANMRRRESSPFLTNMPDASLLDASFAVAAIGDKTYDDLEVAVETNRERRRSMGLALARPVMSSFSSATSGVSDASSSASAITPPQSASNVPFTMRRSPPAQLTMATDETRRTPLRPQPSVSLFDHQVQLKKSTIFTNAPEAETLLDSESFQLTPPGTVNDITPASARRTPLRPQASVALFDKAVNLKKSTIFTTGTDPAALLDSESFQLTPPSSVRTPSATRTPATAARTPYTPTTRPARTPRSLLASRHAPPAPTAPATANEDEEDRTPTKMADATFDIGALLRTGRPKRPSGTEESFLAVGQNAVILADLSADGDDDELDPVAEEMVPAELRPKEQKSMLPPSIPASASLSHLDARGLPSASPVNRAFPRSETARVLPRSDSGRVPGAVESKRSSLLPSSRLSLVPSSSARSLAGLARGTTTPGRRGDRPDVPLTMRRNAATAVARTTGSSAPAPSEPDRWADAVEVDHAPVAAERRVPASLSSRRLSTAPVAGGLTRSGSRTALANATATTGATSGVTRSGSTRTLDRPASNSTLPRSGSSRAIGATDRAPSRESNDIASAAGLKRTSSVKSVSREAAPAAAGTSRGAKRVSAPPGSMAPPPIPAARTSLAPRETVPAATTRAANRISAPPGSMAPPPVPAARTSLAPRSSLAPRAAASRTSIAPRSSLAPRQSVAAGAGAAAPAPRRSLLPPPRPSSSSSAASTGTATSTVSRLSAAPRASSRPSLAPRPRPFGDAAPAANRPAASTATLRSKLSAPPSPMRDAPERCGAVGRVAAATVGAGHKRHMSTPATVAGRTGASAVGTVGTGGTFGAHRRQTTLATLDEFGMPAAGAGAARTTVSRSTRPSTLGGRRGAL